MALLTETSRVQFDGPEAQTAFEVPFRFLEPSHVVVVLTDEDGVDSTLVENTDYTLAPTDTGGTVTLTVGLGADELLTIYRELPVTQPTDYAEQDAFPAESHETALDRATMILQQFQRALSRTVRFTESSPEQDPISTNATPSTVWGYDGDGAFVLRDSAELAEFLSLTLGTLTDNPVATWAVAGDRPSKVPDYTGQVGVQRSDSSIWISTGVVAGNWLLYAIDDDTLAADSDTRPPTQGSVLAYVATREAALQAQIDALSSAVSESGLVESPIGSILSYFSATIPADGTWIFCHGQTLDRAAYPDLFAHWGETFGAGDGITTFLAPDLRGVFLRGFDSGRGVDAARVLGSYQADSVAAHTHPASAVAYQLQSVGAPRGHNYNVTGINNGATGVNTGYTTETRPKNLACNYIAKAAHIGSGGGGVTLSGTLTAGRVPYASSSTLLIDSANLTYVATTATGGLTLANTTPSTSSTTGALIAAGGIGAAKDSFINTHRIGRGVPVLAITSITSATTTATVTTAAHGLATGNTVTIAGATQAEYNGTYVITVTSSTVFTYVFAGSATTPATGTKTATVIYGYATNLCFGFETLNAITSGLAIQNTAVGYRAGKAITTGASNTCIGDTAGASLTTGGQNVAIGSNALASVTTGASNIAIGYLAMDALTTASQNVAIGINALGGITTATGNVAVGYSALSGQTSGNNNTAVGYSAIGIMSGTSANSSAVGYNAGNFNGSSNSSFGYQAGYYYGSGGGTPGGSGDTSVFIGASTRRFGTSATNELVIGYDARGEGSNMIVIGNSSHTQARIFGTLKFGTHAALAAEVLSGYISIIDSGGTARKLAVIS